MAKKPLCLEPTKRILSDRECCAVLGGLLGGLVRVATFENIRNAVEWWANTPEAWEGLATVSKASEAFIKTATGETNGPSN